MTQKECCPDFCADCWPYQQLDRPRQQRSSIIQQQLCSTAAAAQLGSIPGPSGGGAAATAAAEQGFQLCAGCESGALVCFFDSSAVCLYYLLSLDVLVVLLPPPQ
jgi:hypothetical protein